METVSLILLLLLAVVLSDLLSRALASSLPLTIPKPLIQVAFGAAMGLFPSLVTTLEPEVFFLLPQMKRFTPEEVILINMHGAFAPFLFVTNHSDR